MLAAELQGHKFTPPPATTAHGALLSHITGGAMADSFQPVNVNFGLFEPLVTEKRLRGRDRKQAMAARALEQVDSWLETQSA